MIEHSRPRAFQLMAVQPVALMARLIRRFAAPGVTPVLDLEDALWDVADPRTTEANKQRGRQHLCDLAARQPQLLARHPIGIRLNAASDPEFGRDLDLLSSLAPQVFLDCIVLPKVHSPEEVHASSAMLQRSGIRFRARVLIVESNAGLERLDGILSAAAAEGDTWVSYGHYDLSLEGGRWPLLDFDDSDYWEMAMPFIRATEAAGRRFVQPPSDFLTDMAQLSRVVSRLTSVCRHPFGVWSVSGVQSRLIASWTEPAPAPPPGLRAPSPCSEDERIAMALAVCRVFEEHREGHMSYAIDPATGRFIPPHVYLAATRYLRRVHHE